jgi:hypothetical protein
MSMSMTQKKFKAAKKLNIFLIKIAIYLSLGHHKERPGTEETFSPQNIQLFKA